MLTNRFEDALTFAAHLHRTQVRKGSTIPYVSHLLAVASLALEMGADEDQAIAALLHDSIEDQNLPVAEIERRFGADVAEMVAHCTDTGHVVRQDGEDDVSEWRHRKHAYIDSLASKPARSLAVSLADKTHNARCILDEMDAIGHVVFDRFTADRQDVLWYYTELAEAFSHYLPCSAADRFARIVRQMQQCAA